MALKSTFISKKYRPNVKGEFLAPSQPDASISLKLTPTLTDKKREKAIICLHVKDDGSQTNVLKSQAHEANVVFLAYDDLGITWNFSFYKDILEFYLGDKILEPIGIYNRSYCPEVTHDKFHLFHHLLHVLTCWNGSKIGAGMTHTRNSSKGYQSISTIRQAIHEDENKCFKIPKSYYIKGRQQYLNLIAKNQSLIVKSGSGIRSKVVTFETFKNWNINHVNHLPCLFQETCYGYDIRVHWMEEDCWSVIVYEKIDSIDYRYAKKRGPFEKYEDQAELQSFCKKLATIESLRLIGVDFIKINTNYYCLECNPNPGWAGFHRFCGDEPVIAKKMICKLSKTNEAVTS